MVRSKEIISLRKGKVTKVYDNKYSAEYKFKVICDMFYNNDWLCIITDKSICFINRKTSEIIL